jgi:carbon dioxide concentrating mechanism protein CcmN
MSLPSLQLQPVSTSHYYTSGDVTIQAGVAIAPGVLLQAEPNSRILIKAGACIGIGSIFHVYQGTLEVGEGANIGAEVLLIGQVSVGARACIGSATTILNTAIAEGQIIPPGSLIGSMSHQSDELQATDTVIYPESISPTSPSVAEPSVAEPHSSTVSSPAPPASTPENGSTLAHSLPDSEPAAGVNVYGQMYVNQLLVKMFPNRQTNPSTDTDLSEDPWEG